MRPTDNMGFGGLPIQFQLMQPASSSPTGELDILAGRVPAPQAQGQTIPLMFPSNAMATGSPQIDMGGMTNALMGLSNSFAGSNGGGSIYEQMQNMQMVITEALNRILASLPQLMAGAGNGGAAAGTAPAGAGSSGTPQAGVPTSMDFSSAGSIADMAQMAASLPKPAERSEESEDSDESDNDSDRDSTTEHASAPQRTSSPAASGTAGAGRQPNIGWAEAQLGKSDEDISSLGNGGQAWCAFFVNNAFREGGGAPPWGDIARVASIRDYAKENDGDTVEWKPVEGGNVSSENAPTVGDAVIWTETAEGDSEGHTGIVTDVREIKDEQGNVVDYEFDTIEGNSGDEVATRTYKVSEEAAKSGKALRGFVTVNE